MSVRDRLQQLGLVKPPPPVRRYRTYTPRAPGDPEARELPFGPFQTADDWGPDLELWRGNKLSLNIVGNTIQIQLSRTMPPAPPSWGGPIALQPGPYSHVGPFGYFRFRSRSAGQPATVEGTAFSE